MVKSYERESEVLTLLGYGSNTRESVNVNPTRFVRSDQHINPNSKRVRTVYADERKHLKQSKVILTQGLDREVKQVMKRLSICVILCVVLMLWVYSHAVTAQNDRQIQQLTNSIAQAQALHESLSNEVAIRSNQVVIATQARHLGMVQNPEEMSVSLVNGSNSNLLGRQIADAR